MVVICVGPVCIPLWPVLALTLKPVWDKLVPEAAKKWLIAMWMKLRHALCPRRTPEVKHKQVASHHANGPASIRAIQTEEEYKAALAATNKRPAVIKFTADFCNPCKLVAPRVLELAHEYEGKAEFFEIDIEQLDGLAIDLGVTSIPAFHVISNGAKVDEVVGTNMDKLAHYIAQHTRSKAGVRETSKNK
jgi:thioredoxin 1